MDKFIIEGGPPLQGEVTISGAKNSALPLLAATILAPGQHQLSNVPKLLDVKTMGRLLEKLGAEVDHSRLSCENILTINTDNLNNATAPYEMVKTMRASILVLGPLLARKGQAEVSLPGGCAIGARPVNLHLKGLEALGAQIQVEHGYIKAQARKLRGREIHFDTSTVTGTENLLMAAVLAEGTTVLNNAAMEPEVTELAEVLSSMGARISGAGTERLIIEGVKDLKPISHEIMPDRIEAGTFLLAAAITSGDLVIKKARMEHLHALVDKLQEAGVQISESNEGLSVRRRGPLVSVDIKTQAYPGFPTDMQAQFMALMCLVPGGLSVITETVFENRFMHVLELQRMGAEIRIEGHSALVHGVASLSGSKVMATDLRASASLVLAGMVADGTTEVARIYHLDRGYENLEQKLNKLGARIQRVPE
jgi:UDP-N-acetylglucosamine 1-carboxyvinyltransferase